MKTIKFIDLFAGIGGFHIALNNIKEIKSECVCVCEIEPTAKKLYSANFGWPIDQIKDIKEVDPSTLPDFDLLCGGFPCQSFSTLGKRLGFEDTRGTLFFEIARIIKEKKPKYLLLENVEGLISHDKGRTYQTIINTLNDLGYATPKEPLILNPINFRIPQNRPRVFIPCIYGLNADISFKFKKDNWLFKADVKKVRDYIVNDFLKEDNVYNFETSKRIKKYYECYVELIDNINDLPKRFNIIDLLNNEEFYNRHKTFLDNWVLKHNVKKFSKWYQKCFFAFDRSNTQAEDLFYQMRLSGMIFYNPRYIKAITTNDTCNSYIKNGELRQLSGYDALKLQSFPSNYNCLDFSNEKIKEKAGNAVNCYVVEQVLRQLLLSNEEDIKEYNLFNFNN